MDKPIHWEMIKLIRNPSPNFIAVKKIAIAVSKTMVRIKNLMTVFIVICSLAEFITIQLIKFSVRTSIDLSFLRFHTQKDNQIFSVPVIAGKPEGFKASWHPSFLACKTLQVLFRLRHFYAAQSSKNACTAWRPAIMAGVYPPPWDHALARYSPLTGVLTSNRFIWAPWRSYP
jgi:hypothetical protein